MAVLFMYAICIPLKRKCVNFSNFLKLHTCYENTFWRILQVFMSTLDCKSKCEICYNLKSTNKSVKLL